MDDFSFAVTTQDRTQFGNEIVKDETRSASEKQMRTFATQFRIVADSIEPENRDDIRKLSFRLCYFSQCPKTGLGANRLPVLITYAQKLMRYVRCACSVGQFCAGKESKEQLVEEKETPQADAKMKGEEAVR